MSRLTHCPNCDSNIQPGAIVCIDCGYHVKSGRQVNTQSRPVRQVFGASPMTPWRYYPAIGLVILGTVLCLLSAVLSQSIYRDHGAAVVAFPVGLALLSAPVFLGYGHSVTVMRDKKGEPIVVKNTWFFFRPIGANTLFLNDWDALYFSYYRDGNDYPHYILKIGRDRRSKLFKLYHGSDKMQMHDIADAIKDLTGMRFERL